MPVAGSQIRTVPSPLAVASQLPSGAIATAHTVSVWPVRVWRWVPVAGSQIRTVPSPAAGGQPGAVRGDRHRTHAVGVAGEGVAWVPVAGSQIRTVPSQLAVASQVPSGAIATACTLPVWPVRVWRWVPVAGSQIRTVPSSLPVASQVPSGAIATARTLPVWPVRVWRWVPVAGSQIRTVPSSLPVASQVPSGAIATARHVAGVAGEGVAFGAGDRIPDPHRAVPLPVASQVPSGAIATARTLPVWPVRVRRRAGCGRSGSGATACRHCPGSAPLKPFSDGGQDRIVGQARQQHPGQGAGRVEGGKYGRVLSDHLLQGGAGGVAGQGKVGFQAGRSDVVELSDQPAGVLDGRLEFVVQTGAL